MPLMPLTVDTFRNLANSSRVPARDIVVSGGNEARTARLGNMVFSTAKAVNIATMSAFKEAMEAEYGVFGTQAFDTVLGTRNQLGLSLRVEDVKKTLSHLDNVKRQRWISEMNRQLDSDPKVLALSLDVNRELRAWLQTHRFGDPAVDVSQIASQDELVRRVSETIRLAIPAAMAEVNAGNGNIDVKDLSRANVAAPRGAAVETAPDEPTGLREFGGDAVFGSLYTSVEDMVKSGLVGAGERVNRHRSHPVLLEKLKTNGVEPGFIYRNDWSHDDTLGFMADIWSDDNRAALDALVERTPSLRAKRDGNPPATRRELAMAAGRACPCAMAAVAERILERELGKAGSPIHTAFHAKFQGVDVAALFPPGGAEPGAEAKRILAQVKSELFLEIRHAVMNEPSTSDDFKKSPLFGHFADRNIVKLDYNEGDRADPKAPGSRGALRLPERVAARFGAIKGFLYRTFRLTTADEASVGAVREALANDITRLLGIPAQELSLVHGEYSDGHPKLMLAAKFAEGYQDLADGFLQDGHAVAPPGADPIEPLGRYKALFLALADRDAVGSHGQNKGLVGGRFFAIDPGHSLEGNGPDLEIRDDLSFTDRKKGTLEKRFDNYSVFDDDTRFAKFQGVLKLRELMRSRRIDDLFADYLATFRTDGEGLSPAERRLREKIIFNVGAMSAEFHRQVERILEVFGPQLAAFDALAENPPQGAPTQLQVKAIETIGNLEKLTSPTRWTSPNGTVDLKHLAVDQRTRIPWQLTVQANGDLVYSTAKNLDQTARNRLIDFCHRGGGAIAPGERGGVTVTVPAARRKDFFQAFQETNIIDEKHAGELPGRIARDQERARLDMEERERRRLAAAAPV